MSSFDMHIDSRYRNILEYPNSTDFVLLCNPSPSGVASFNQQYIKNSIFYRWNFNGFYSVVFPGYEESSSVSTLSFPKPKQPNNALLGRIQSTPDRDKVILPSYLISNEVNLYSGLLFVLYAPSVPLDKVNNVAEVYVQENIKASSIIQYYNPLTNLIILSQAINVQDYYPGAYFAIVNPSYLYANQVNLLGINEFVSVLSQNFAAQAILKQSLSSNYFVQNVTKGWVLPIGSFTNDLRTIEFEENMPSFDQRDLFQIRPENPSPLCLFTRDKLPTDTNEFTGAKQQSIQSYQMLTYGNSPQTMYQVGQLISVVPVFLFSSSLFAQQQLNNVQASFATYKITKLVFTQASVLQWEMEIVDPGENYEIGIRCALVPVVLLSNPSSFQVVVDSYATLTVTNVCYSVPLNSTDKEKVLQVVGAVKRFEESMDSLSSILMYAPAYKELITQLPPDELPGLTQISRNVYYPPTSTTYEYQGIQGDQQFWLFYSLFNVDYSISSIFGVSVLGIKLDDRNFVGPESYLLRYNTLVEFIPIYQRTVGLTMPFISYSQPICYRARLISLSLPNEPVVGYSLLPSFFPYFLIELSNTTGLASNQQLIYSNNPYTTKTTFVATIANPRNQEIANYVVVYSFQTTIMKFIPTDHLRIRILLPNGQPLQYVYDQRSIELSESSSTKDFFFLRSLYAEYTFKNINLRLQFIQNPI